MDERPSDEELIAEARKITGQTLIGSTRWLPAKHIHLLADALEAALERERSRG